MWLLVPHNLWGLVPPNKQTHPTPATWAPKEAGRQTSSLTWRTRQGLATWILVWALALTSGWPWRRCMARTTSPGGAQHLQGLRHGGQLQSKRGIHHEARTTGRRAKEGAGPLGTRTQGACCKEKHSILHSDKCQGGHGGSASVL